MALKLLPDGRPIVWQPHPGPQTRFLATRCNEVLYGGAAAGGKTAGIIAMPCRWVPHPNFRALILRREGPQLGDLLAKAEALYPTSLFRARPKSVGSSVIWRFPSGAQVWFTHCEGETDYERFDGFEFQLIEFDELTHFTEEQYRRIGARIRSPHRDLPRYRRSSTNPGGPGHPWVFDRWGAWLDPNAVVPGLGKADGKTPLAASGQVLHFAMQNGIWRVVRPEEKGDDGEPAMSRTFIGAKLSDNPSITQNDPGYVAALNQLDAVRREQLKAGNWLVSYSSGSLFKKQWWKYLDAVPADVTQWVRKWDFAATEPNDANKDPDWTRGVKMGKTTDGRFIITDVESIRGTPGAVEALVAETAIRDGEHVQVRVPEDPGSAGKVVAARFCSLLSGYDVHADRETGDKVTRARPLSAQAEAGNVYLIRGPWNRVFTDELEAFPTTGVHDDQMDGASGAFSALQPTSDEEALSRRLAAYKNWRPA